MHNTLMCLFLFLVTFLHIKQQYKHIFLQAAQIAYTIKIIIHLTLSLYFFVTYSISYTPTATGSIYCQRRWVYDRILAELIP